jgi:putative protease
VHNGDGICFFDKKGVLCGSLIHKAEGSKVFPDSMKSILAGMEIYRNLDAVFERQLNKSRTRRAIAVRLTMNRDPAAVRFLLRDEDGIVAAVERKNVFQPAEKKEEYITFLEKQFSRLGNTEFILENVSVEIDPPPFIPANTLNQIRRELAEALRENRAASYQRAGRPITTTDHPFPDKTIDFTENVLNKKAEAFYRRHGVKTIEKAAESGLVLKGRPVMISRYCIPYESGLCQGPGRAAPGPFVLSDANYRTFRLALNCARCGAAYRMALIPQGEKPAPVPRPDRRKSVPAA